MQAEQFRQQRTQAVSSVHAIPGAAAHVARASAQRPGSNPPRGGKGSAQHSREPSPINAAVAGPSRPATHASRPSADASLTAQVRGPVRQAFTGSAYPQEPARVQALRSSDSASSGRTAQAAAAPSSQDSSAHEAPASAAARRGGSAAAASSNATAPPNQSRLRPVSAPIGAAAGASKPAFGSSSAAVGAGRDARPGSTAGAHAGVTSRCVCSAAVSLCCRQLTFALTPAVRARRTLYTCSRARCCNHYLLLVLLLGPHVALIQVSTRAFAK